MLKSYLGPNDIAGRFAGVSFLALLERGNPHDVEAWAEPCSRASAKAPRRSARRSVHSSCTVGLTAVPTAGSSLDAIVADVVEAVRRGRSQGGNQIYHLDKADTDTRVQAYDRIWVKHIKSALMENRFRLVQQPVASLQGEDPNMFDVLVRMLDNQGKEVLPAEFMAAAERNDLLKNIDRWVVGASLSFAAQTQAGLPVRAPVEGQRASTPASSTGSKTQLARGRARAEAPVLPDHREHRRAVHERRDGAARRAQEARLPHRARAFRLGPRSAQAADRRAARLHQDRRRARAGPGRRTPRRRSRCKKLVEQANKRKIETIAERVEDANTMAVLWQLGVQFIQGYFVNAPEEVVMAEGQGRR